MQRDRSQCVRRPRSAAAGARKPARQRHSPRAARSVVHLVATRHEEHVEIRVSDNGSGIPEDLRERIFERFVQVEQGDRFVSRAGRGLGLTFCKLAVEAHGGKIWLESEEGAGSVFAFALPLGSSDV